ncbi:MAG: hypothetical protein AAF542_04635 [Pseudomonadota bacterium]
MLIACGGGGGGGGDASAPTVTNTGGAGNDNTDADGGVNDDPSGNDVISNEPNPFDDDSDLFTVETGNVVFEVDRLAFNLRARNNETALINSINATLVFNGNPISIGRPESYSTGPNWIEQQGWFDQASNLWYVARFQFWDDAPFVQLTMSLTDRHDDHATEAHWDNLWQQRSIENLRIIVEGNTDLVAQSITQENAFSGGNLQTGSRIEEVANASEVHWRQTATADGRIQLEHSRDNSRQTYLRIHPRMTGQYNLSLHQLPLFSPYPAANAVEVEIHHSNGIDRQTVDQGFASNALGSFILDADSFVQVIATGEEGDRVVFERLELVDMDGTVSQVSATRLDDDVISAEPLGLVVRDFWKKFPISASTSNQFMVMQGIEEPVDIVGGVGFTFDIGINADVNSGSNAELAQRIRATPEVSFPDWWTELDGRIVDSDAYRQLLDRGADVIRQNDETSGNYGLMNWGDYQIGISFIADGERYEDWGALQYDLGLGLLNAWAQTGNAYFYDRAHAAVRSSMDIQVAKFEPYSQKRSGAGIRKGQCAERFHWCQENIPEFNYHSRSLLLFSHLTGEQWPRQIAKMVIDNSAYFSLTRRPWTLDHPRILGWSLRNLYYGAVDFPQGTEYSETQEVGFLSLPRGTAYRELLVDLVQATVGTIEAGGRVQGEQPVWAGQVIEGLIIAVESDLLDAALQARTRAAIDIAVSHFLENHLRRNAAGDYEMMYAISDSEWRGAASYGWFWINNLAWASENLDASYAVGFNAFYDWLYDSFRNGTGAQSTRAWSGALGFSAYAAQVKAAGS